MEHVLSYMTFIPLAGMVVVLLLPSNSHNLIRWVAAAFTVPPLLMALWLVAHFDASQAGFQFKEQWAWIPAYNIQYFVGVDGLSISMVLLTALLSFICIFASWGIEKAVKGYFALFLLLVTGMMGVFVALDFFLFYIFWEVMLLPMYFLIGIWGGPRKIYAAIKFFLYTMAGSILMLLAILWLGINMGTFSVPAIMASGVPAAMQGLLFWGFAAAFAIKVPVWPLHSWLPDAHVEAPTAGSVILAGVLLKLGTYGFLRFNLGLFPQATIQFAPVMAVLAVIGILYGAIVSYAQSDAKKLVAYSSVSHLGFVMLGLFALNPQGIQGAVLQMVNHGLSTGALFLLVGVIYERRHTRELAQFGGLWKIMPIYGTLMLIVALSSMGLPGLNGFVGEFAILLGAWGAGGAGGSLGSYWYAALAAIGVILAAVYLLWMFQRMFLGEVTNEKNRGLSDLSRREIAILVPLLILIFWIGLYPKPFLDLMAPSVQHLTAGLQAAAVAMR